MSGPEKIENLRTTSERENVQTTSAVSTRSLRSGDEPTELLLALLSSPLLTLWLRKRVRIYNDPSVGRVVIEIANAHFSKEAGIEEVLAALPTVKEK